MTSYKRSLLVVLSASLFLFSSCVMTKTYTVEEQKMLLENKVPFVEKNNGQIVTGTKMTFPSAFSKKGWIAIDGEKFQPDEIKAYQTKNAYHVKFGTDNDWLWVTQLKRGKINLFYYDVQTHSSYFDGVKWRSDNKSTQHFVFQKGDDKLYELGIKEISELLKDNQAASDKFNTQFKPGKKFLPKQLQNHPKVLFDAIDLYNN